MTRREFSPKTKVAAFERAAGICECGCGRKFGNHPKERPVYDHIVPDALGGDNTLENCAAIRADCHAVRTNGRDGDIAKVAKAKRGERQRMGVERQKNPLPGGKGSKWKQKIGGGWVRRDE